MPFSAKRIPDKLKDAYRGNRCAILVGAGASVGAGLPNWGEFLNKMIQKSLDHAVISDEKADEYRSLVADPGKYLMAAAGLKEDMSAYFDEFIEEVFVAPAPSPTDLHRAITATDRLQFVLTTNYDMLLELAYREAGKHGVS